jgi:hypothetical protein
VSRRKALRETGNWKTLKKVLEHSKPPGYRQDLQLAKRRLEECGNKMCHLDEVT